jgi:hypothetical protein
VRVRRAVPGERGASLADDRVDGEFQVVGVAQSTVAKHLEQAYSKLGVHSRTAAVARLAKLSE